MALKFELDDALYGPEFDGVNADITREVIMQYISAGILFPDEIRQAEQILRHLNRK